ncbi:Protein CBG20081 [Caenorhabditis briggsae]|uniref:Protein CBG20081 n=1 Tax=Caenorhabditis briggsae TaxID=6238 RepID=A8XX18_CAEBR|nr:Protein CBG20081 [Caenorhabditis briggsae]CAP37187.1 Protein CBG20081 [Caenorhabditis briggsae]
MMEHYTTNCWLEEANAGTAGIISLFANCLLIYLTTKVKSYSDTVKWCQYYSCCFRLAFSLLVVISAPTIMYLNEVKSLFIVKGGIKIATNIGCILLNLFLVFVVTSCTGPAVQYLKITYLLSSPVLKNHSVLRAMITLIPLFVAIPTSILIFNGYMPNEYEKEISKDLIQEITGENNNAFLIESEEMFIFPFITIHIPFYVAFILPFADIELNNISSKLPYMFAWCPAINPIMVICMIKTVMYLDETKALYIAKGGFDLPIDIGCILLILFLVFVVTSCTGPAVQYLQVTHLLCSPVQKTHSVLRTMITLIPLFVAVPTSILIFNGYVPNEYEKEISKDMILVITGKNDCSFLMAAEEKIYDFSSGTFAYDVPARICTGFIFSAMFLSLIVVILCSIKMQITMKKKTSISNQKSQKQLNLLLFVQFIFPFITIHIPFYVAFILPFADIEFNNLSSKLPYMFAWCPAINPILVICMIKSIRDKLLNRKGTPWTGTTFTTSTQIFHVRTNTQVMKRTK